MPVTNLPFLPTALDRRTLPPSHFSPAGTWGAQHSALSEQTWAKMPRKESWGVLFTLIISLMWIRGLERGCSHGGRLCSRNTLLLKERRGGQSGVILALGQFTGVVLHCASPKKV